MIRKLIPAAICLSVFVSPAAARAAGGVKGAFAAVPGDAMLVLCVPHLQQLDASYQQVTSAMGLQAMIPPPMNSVVAFIKQKLPMFQGIDEAGSFAVVLMPAGTLFELQQTTAFLVPAKDPKAMIEAMEGKAGEEGLWTVMMFGQPSFAAIQGSHLIVAQTQATAKAIMASKISLADTLKARELSALSGLDVVLWVNAGRLFKLIKPMMDMALAPMMMQGAGGGFQAKQAQASKQQLDMLIDGMSSGGLGVSLDPGGLGLRFFINTKPGSDLAKQSRMHNTAESLLRGLPADRFLIAIGQTATPESSQAGLKSLDTYFSMADEIEGIDKEKVHQLQDMLKEWAPLATSVRGVVEALPSSTSGLFGVSVVIESSDSKKWVELAGKVADSARAILLGAKSADIPDELKQLAEALIHKTDAESIRGVEVEHFKLDLAQVKEIEEDDLEDIWKIIGKEGMVFRMAAVDAKTAVLTFGGGKEYMARLIDSVKKNEPALDYVTGIKKVAAKHPRERASVIYVAVDKIVTSINNALKAIEEEELPVHLPTLDAPLAITVSGGDGWSRFDALFPMDLLRAGKDAALVLMGSGSPGGVPPAVPATPR